MKQKIYYHWQQYDWEETGRIYPDTMDRSCSSNFILLKIIEVDLPDVTEPSRELVVKHKVAKLQEEKTKLQAETHIKIKKIDEKISQLQSLENKQ